MDQALQQQLGLAAWPEFGDQVSHRSEPCTPRELFCRLFVDLEDHLHYVQPAFSFVTAALQRAEVPAYAADTPLGYIEGVVLRCGAGSATQSVLVQHDPTYVVRELAPTGLSDGTWLRGWVQSNMVETEAGMSALKQFMARFGDPGTRESYTQRYASLLRSIGIVPESVTRLDEGSRLPCSDAAYEHALLGVCLGLFPSTLGLETLGFNLWMTVFGPCPLLLSLLPELTARGACVRYVEQHDQPGMQALAWESVTRVLADTRDPQLAAVRIARGFSAAERSYAHWERSLGDNTLPLTGDYRAPQDETSLEAFALQRYGALSLRELYYHFINADRFPAVQIFSRVFTQGVFTQLEQVFASDPRLNSQTPPCYSERGVAEIVAAQYEKNVSSRGQRAAESGDVDVDASTSPGITQVFDGAWLQGFADVARSGLEEYGWLFRIYASEHGDGDFAWNHCQIFRRAFAELGPDVMLPKTEPRLYELFEIGVAPLTTVAVSLNTRHFLPEILGLNMAIEATGVGGQYLDQLKWARRKRLQWRALAWRLHNSIDNHIDGHTKWSQAAVQSFMRRVKECAPAQVEAQWGRIWRLWRLQDILTHGSESERSALAEYLDVGSLAPA